MKGPATALLLLALAIALRATFQTPFEVLNTTIWSPLLPPLPGQFLAAYLVPQLAIFGAVACWPGGFSRLADKLLTWLQPLWLCPLLVLTASLLFRRFGLLDTLCVSDELSFNFHAICLAGGRPGCSPPPFPDHFQYATLYIGPKIWTGISSPGWPMLLALGYWLGCPRLVSPLLAGVITLQLQTLARRWFGPRAAALTGLMLLASPMFMLNACADYSHLATLFWSANTLLCLERVEGPGRGRGWAALGGLCLGMVVTTRPLDGLLLVCGVLAWRVFFPLQKIRPGLFEIALVGLGMVPTAALNFLQNIAVSGHPLVTAYELLGEVSGQFDLDPLSRLALFAYIFARAGVWMFPGFLESIPSLRQSGKFGLILLGLYAIAYARPGFFEIGSRYVLNACLLALPWMAGAICQSQYRQAWIPPCLALSLLAAFPGEARSVMSLYRYQWAVDDWMNRSLPSNSIAFFRRLPAGALGVARNYPDLPGRISVLALDPKENLQLRQRFADHPAYFLDWIPEQRGYQITPFEEPHDPNLDRICAGMNYANLKSTKEKALQQWAQIPVNSPFYEAARQNRIKLLRGLGRQEEASKL